MKMKIEKLVILFIALALSCGEDTTLYAEDFNQSCSNDRDCIAVLVGDICDCICKYDSIAIVESENYEKKKNSMKCGNSCEDLTCGPCFERPQPFCSEGTCRIPTGV